MTTPLPYSVKVGSDHHWYAVLSRGEEVGPFRTLAELERDMELLAEHIARRSFGGAK